MPKIDRSHQQEFRIIPILGRKVNVPQNDPSLFKIINENTAFTHDVGGVNFDLERLKNVCTKSYGSLQWSNSANSEATKCLGLFELYDGTNRNHIAFDNGKCFIYDASMDPQIKNDAKLAYDGQTGDFTLGLIITGGTSSATGVIIRDEDAGVTGTLYLQSITGTFEDNEAITDPDTGAAVVNGTLQATTFATDDTDLFSSIRIGDYMVFTDRGEHMPYKWKNGDTALSPLIVSGTAYKFRWIVSFMRRIIGLYSDQTNGNIELRYSTAWPTIAITNLNFPAANQLWIPNDDPIVGAAVMSQNRCFIYCENSIQQLVYYPDYLMPFRIYTMLSQQGVSGHHSIVNIGDKHFFFNPNYGFCEYIGGTEIRSISEDIKSDIRTIGTSFYDLIVGKFIPLTRQIVWTVPLGGVSTPDHLVFYNIDTRQWTIEDKPARYVDAWQIFTNFTWDDLLAVADTWEGHGLNKWANYTSERKKPVFANTDGQTYACDSETLDGSNIDGYRIEPVLSFGNAKRKDLLREIWFDLVSSGVFSIDVYHRWGDTLGELTNQSWTFLDSLSCNNPNYPVVYPTKTARLHQIKWGTNLKDESFQVSGITFKYVPQTEK